MAAGRRPKKTNIQKNKLLESISTAIIKYNINSTAALGFVGQV